MTAAYAQEFLNFVNASPSPFHAVDQCKRRLLASGFTELKEKLTWDLKPKGKYFFTRNQSSIVAFSVGGRYVPGNGFSIIGAHTDSPCLKLKPVSRKETSTGYQQVGVQLYGGGLWHTWFDRDLSVAGRVVVQNGEKLEGKLVRVNMQVFPNTIRIEYRTVSEKFAFNNETQLTPILSTIVKAQLEKTDDKNKPNHHPALMKLLASQLSIEVSQIRDFELCLYDTQPSSVGGLYGEFIFSPRLDNLMMSYCSLEALIQSTDKTDASLDNDTNIRLIALFDNEEVGSESAYGAGSNLLESAIRRINQDTALFDCAIQNSYLISADMARAVHPNYSDKHESNHQPQIHGGVVIKINANQRYATTSFTSTLLKSLAAQCKPPVPLQEFVVRNDSPCGSTIGPILSSKLGLRTIDVGSPMLSMHSIREMCGTDDIAHSIHLFIAFFRNFAAIDAHVICD